MKPIAGETTITYATRLREKAQDCEFGDASQCDERILEHMIQTTENESLYQKCISKGWNLSQFLTEAGPIEDISLQLRDMKIIDQERQNAKVDKNKGYEWKQRHANRKAESEINPCGYCGLKKMHTDRKSCPAYGKTSAKCQKLNHFASACRADRFRIQINEMNYDIRRGRNRV